MIKRIALGLFLALAGFNAPLAAQQNTNIRLGDLPAYTLADVSTDPTAQDFAALIGQDKVQEAFAEAEKAISNDKPIGNFLLGLAAEQGKGAAPDAAKAEKYYREGAKRNHVPSVTNLAALLMRQNPANEEAVKLLRSVVEKDPKIAGFFLGIACLSGATGTPDFQSAAQMWSKSAEDGNNIAHRHLGYLYQGTFGFPAQTDLKKAAEAYQKGSDAGDAESSVRLGLLILQAGDKIDRKPAEAASWFEKAASTNSPAALFMLGQIREQGVPGSPADPKVAREIYQKGAALDHAPSIFKLGYMTERGLGGSTSLPEAIKLYRKAAEMGEAGAYFNLGILTQKGEGLEKSEPEAFRLMLQSALRGFSPAAFLVGSAYRTGRGVTPDFIAAAAWFSRAAEAGETNAMVNLAEMMLSNQGIPFNGELLGQLTQRAFNAGNPSAGLLIGRMAERGVGLQANLPQALAFYRWAAKRDLEDAKKAATELEKSLTKDQIQAADIFLKQLEEQQKKEEPAADDKKAGDDKDKKKAE